MLYSRNTFLCFLIFAFLDLQCGNLQYAKDKSNCSLEFTNDIRPIFETYCYNCHYGDKKEGDVDLDDFPSLFDKGYIIPGDKEIPLLKRIEPTDGKDFKYLKDQNEYEYIKKWVVECNAQYFDSVVHPQQWLNPTSQDFHGLYIKKSGWDIDECRQCHGKDYKKGYNEKDGCYHCHKDGPQYCNVCHGDKDSYAPPKDTSLKTSTDKVTVGAHRSHLKEDISKNVKCSSCHRVPSEFNSPGHIDNDGMAEVIFDNLATDDGRLSPLFSSKKATCSDVYCHGATLDNGKFKEPSWTDLSGEVKQCDSCHGLPPHKYGDKQCQKCHGAVTDDGKSIKDPSLHIDKKIEINKLECYSCHGDQNNSAPPPAADGSTDTSDIGVGAHYNHTRGGDITRGFDCSECHIKPKEVLDPGHLDDSEGAEVIFGDFATQNGQLDSKWEPDSATCKNIYCHGNGLDSSNGFEPVWTKPEMYKPSCSSCHKNPPDNHRLSRCWICHTGVTSDDETTSDKQLHINGKIDLANDDQQCFDCHGDSTSFAPPPALDGSISTQSKGVGAHRSHVLNNTISEPFDCTVCHIKPDKPTSTGHIDKDTIGTAEVTFQGLAKNGGLEPVWDEDSLTCSDVYCHGATLIGGNNKSPMWNVVDGSQKSCDSCHGYPPENHLRVLDCSKCHLLTTTSSSITGKAYHINGEIDLTPQDATCNGTCHGDLQSDAPPNDLEGNSETSSLGVGAHRAHTQPSSISNGFDCSVCHIKPQSVDDPFHIDTTSIGIAEVIFSSVATAEGNSPIWDRSTGTCRNVYCHGGASTGEISWTDQSGTPGQCGFCHAIPPPSPHPQFSIDKCYICHADVVDQNGDIINGELHINGQVDY